MALWDSGNDPYWNISSLFQTEAARRQQGGAGAPMQPPPAGYASWEEYYQKRDQAPGSVIYRTAKGYRDGLQNIGRSTVGVQVGLPVGGNPLTVGPAAGPGAPAPMGNAALPTFGQPTMNTPNIGRSVVGAPPPLGIGPLGGTGTPTPSPTSGFAGKLPYIAELVGTAADVYGGVKQRELEKQRLAEQKREAMAKEEEARKRREDERVTALMNAMAAFRPRY